VSGLTLDGLRRLDALAVARPTTGAPVPTTAARPRPVEAGDHPHRTGDLSPLGPESATTAASDPLLASHGRAVTQLATLTPEAGPQDIAAAEDGSMWFAQANVGNAARVTADGAITEEGRAVGDDPDSGLENALGIAFRADPDSPAGPDAASVWFTMQAANKIVALLQK
jgi:hypothetical protein